MKGIVKFFLKDKQYGFITADKTPDSPKHDVFLHRTSITEELTQGDRVEFEEKENDRGKFAVNVVKI